MQIGSSQETTYQWGMIIGNQYGANLIAFGIVSRFAGYRYWFRYLWMDIIAMTALSASVNKTSAFELCDEFPYLGWHTVISILLRDAFSSLRSQIWLSTGAFRVGGW